MLQVLTVSSADEVDPKTRDLYSKFTRGCMSFLLDGLLDAPCSPSPPQTTLQAAIFCRSSMMLSCSELSDIVRIHLAYFQLIYCGYVIRVAW